MPHNLPDRLRAEANAIDSMTGLIDVRELMLEAAGHIDRMHHQIADRLPGEIAKRCDTWSSTLSAVSRLKTERNNAIEEVDRMRAQNIMLVKFGSAWAQKAGADDQAFDYLSEQLSLPNWCLSEIQAQAVEAILSDLKRDMPDTNTLRRIFQRMQLRVDVLRAKQPITNPTENSSQLVIGDSNSDRGGSGYDREVLGQNNEGDTVTV